GIVSLKASTGPEISSPVVRQARTCSATTSTSSTGTPARAQKAPSVPPIAPAPQIRIGSDWLIASVGRRLDIHRERIFIDARLDRHLALLHRPGRTDRRDRQALVVLQDQFVGLFQEATALGFLHLDGGV